MAKLSRRAHSPALKVKVALAAVNAEKNAGRTEVAVRCPSQPDQQLEEAVAGGRGGCFRTGQERAEGSRRRPEGSSYENRRTGAGKRFLIRRALQDGIAGRKKMIDRDHDLPITRQAKALGVALS